MYESRHAPLASRHRFVRRLLNHFVLSMAVVALSLWSVSVDTVIRRIGLA
jgi:hypothetical protein